MAHSTSSFHINRRQLIVAVVLVIGLYVLVPQFSSFRSSLHLLRHPSAPDTTIAIVFTALTYLAAALTYCFLAFRRLIYGQVVLVQLAAMFINRLLPAGIGALGVNYSYLRKTKHTAAQATTMVGLNNLVGFAGNLSLIAIVLAIDGRNATTTSGQLHIKTALIAVAGLTLVLLLVGLIAGKRFKRLARDIRKQLLSYRHRPWRLVGALLSSMALTLCNALCLYFCAQALGVHLSLAPILLILTFGVGAGAATPTPGGLGGFEAGLVAGFVAYHVDSSSALAVALLYRLISYWLVLVAGAIAFIVVQRRKLLNI